MSKKIMKFIFKLPSTKYTTFENYRTHGMVVTVASDTLYKRLCGINAWVGGDRIT